MIWLVSNFSLFQKLIVHEDYQRVLKEYKEVEEKWTTKLPLNKPNYVRPVSAQKPLEKEKHNPNPLKL